MFAGHQDAITTDVLRARHKPLLLKRRGKSATPAHWSKPGGVYTQTIGRRLTMTEPKNKHSEPHTIPDEKPHWPAKDATARIRDEFWRKFSESACLMDFVRDVQSVAQREMLEEIVATVPPEWRGKVTAVAEGFIAGLVAPRARAACSCSRPMESFSTKGICLHCGGPMDTRAKGAIATGATVDDGTCRHCGAGHVVPTKGLAPYWVCAMCSKGNTNTIANVATAQRCASATASCHCAKQSASAGTCPACTERHRAGMTWDEMLAEDFPGHDPGPNIYGDTTVARTAKGDE